jgi:hypothetical protein
MTVKASIVGFAILAFVGPVFLFVTAVFFYRRWKQHRADEAIHNLEGDSQYAKHPELQRKSSNLDKLSTDAPLVVIGGKKSPASSTGGSRIAAGPAGSQAVSGSSDSMSSSPHMSPLQSPGRPGPLMPPAPAAAVAAPKDAVAVDVSALAAQQQQQLQQQQLRHIQQLPQ